MASLDFVYDIVEKLNEEKVDYLVVSIQHSDDESRSDIFYNEGNNSRCELSEAMAVWLFPSQTGGG